MDKRDFNNALAIRRIDFYTVTKSALAVRTAIGDARIDRVEPFLRDGLAIRAQDSADAAHSPQG